MPEEAFFERFCRACRGMRLCFRPALIYLRSISRRRNERRHFGWRIWFRQYSLPVLYAEALAGQGTDKNFLAVDVNPSWTSPSDLLGYTDALDHRFVPAASGMLNQIILAYHARKALGVSAPRFYGVSGGTEPRSA